MNIVQFTVVFLIRLYQTLLSPVLGAVLGPSARCRFTPSCSQYAREAVRLRNQRVLIARPFNHLGPGQSPTFVVPALVTRLLDAVERGDDEIVVGDLSTRRDFSDVRDVVRAYRLLATLGVSGEAYNVASGHDVALSDIAAQLVERLAPHVALVIDPSLLRPVEIPVFRGSFEKLHQATGWSPEISLHQTLDDVVNDLITRREK